MKRLKLVLVSRIFYRNKPKTARSKGFRTYVESKAKTIKPWKWNYYSVIRKSLDLKVWICVFFKNNFTRTQEPVFLIYYLSLFLPWHFHVWNLFGKQFLTLENNLEDYNNQLLWQPMFSTHEYKKINFESRFSSN